MEMSNFGIKKVKPIACGTIFSTFAYMKQLWVQKKN